MENDVRKVVLTCALFISVMSVSAQLSQHGLVLSGGIGRVDAKIEKSVADLEEISHKFGLSIGYKFRFNTPIPKKFHYDLDINVGSKQVRTLAGFTNELSSNTFTSIGGTANYSLIKNLSLGLGIEPVYYFGIGSESRIKNFDVPFVARIAYNLKFVEIGISGKYGLVKLFETDHLKSGKIHDLQLSLFIPFKTK